MANQSQVYSGIYTGNAIKEGVMQLIYQITPEDTPLLSMIGPGGKATHVKWEWLKRTRGNRQGTAGTTRAVPPGDDLTAISKYSDVARPSRVVNYCEIFRQLIYIDETTLELQHHGINALMADQMEFRFTDFMISIEERFWNGAQNAGPATAGATTAWETDGLFSAISTNSTDLANTAFQETDLKNMFITLWNSGAKPQDLFCGPNTRDIIDLFNAGGATRFLDTTDRRVVRTVSVYEGTTQTVEMHLSRDINDAASTADLVIIDRTFLKPMWLREPFIQRLPQIRGAEMARIEGQVTLQYGDEAAHGEILNRA